MPWIAAAIMLAAAACSGGEESREEAAAPAKAPVEIKAAAAPSAPAPAPSGPPGPAPKLELVPQIVTATTVIHAEASGFDPASARIIWVMDGLDTTTAEEFSFDVAAEHVRKGTEIRAKALLDGREVVSEPVVVRNSPPRLTKVRIMPEEFRPGDRVYADVAAEDADGDPVNFEFEWRKNKLRAGISNTLDVDIARGDVFSVRIAPYDGEEYGRPITLTREARNLPPLFRPFTKEDYRFEGYFYSSQVEAFDPDGDLITYALRGAPEGMTIDPSSGYIRWDVPREVSGLITYTVVATDGQGGEATQEMRMTIAIVGVPGVVQNTPVGVGNAPGATPGGGAVNTPSGAQ